MSAMTKPRIKSIAWSREGTPAERTGVSATEAEAETVMAAADRFYKVSGAERRDAAGSTIVTGVTTR
jgi:hypothetical protein